VWWVVVAAGNSSRMGAKGSKMWLLVKEKPLMHLVLSRIRDAGQASGGAVVVRPDQETATRTVLNQVFPQERWDLAIGGDSRAASVSNGLDLVLKLGAEPEDVVLIHDGARPLVSTELVERVVSRTLSDGAAIPLLAVSDTVKQWDPASGRLLGTVDRTRLGLAQTPQGFLLGSIREAHARFEGATPTDDAEVMERAGYSVAAVAGEWENRKITTAEDFEWLVWWLEREGDY
jgi:2-C-methyl-D-erythritol 4-phosphate cytidylyltransferase